MLNLDVNTLTLGEVARFEDLSGQSISQLGDESVPKGKALAALAFLVKRRQELAAGEKPSFTWNQAQELTIAEANALLGLDADDEPADEPVKAKGRKKVDDDPKDA
jgi:hypothetical protein